MTSILISKSQPPWSRVTDEALTLSLDKSTSSSSKITDKQGPEIYSQYDLAPSQSFFSVVNDICEFIRHN